MTSRIKKVAWFVVLLPVSVPVFIFLRLSRPFIRIRLGQLESKRIGHFAANTELYLCERDASINMPKGRYVDIFFMAEPVCNAQLAEMWKRVILIVPNWLVFGAFVLNRLLPGGAYHEVTGPTQKDRDVRNLMEKYSPHLTFTEEEEKDGQAGLRAIGIPPNEKFVCLTVRDSAYLSLQFRDKDLSYHNYRDSDIDNYMLAAQELGRRGYYVVRMGAAVNKPMNNRDFRVIDYASNGMRGDFMDIYLGAKCEFCISQGTGFDAVPVVFRRPVAYVNMVPISYFNSWTRGAIGLFKHHVLRESGTKLTLREIVQHEVDKCLCSSCYESRGILLEENKPEEIRDVCLQMAEILEGTWSPGEEDRDLQEAFWNVYPIAATSVNQVKLHGKVRAQYGAKFLRENESWLQ